MLALSQVCKALVTARDLQARQPRLASWQIPWNLKYGLATIKGRGLGAWHTHAEWVRLGAHRRVAAARRLPGCCGHARVGLCGPGLARGCRGGPRAGLRALLTLACGRRRVRCGCSLRVQGRLS